MAFSPLELTSLVQVFDMTASLAFYRDVLGFTVVAASPEVDTAEGRFSHWVTLALGPVRLMLNTQYDSNERPTHADPARHATHGDTSFHIACPDIDSAYRELGERGLQADPPSATPYGLNAFRATDPDGYEIVIHEAR